MYYLKIVQFVQKRPDSIFKQTNKKLIRLLSLELLIPKNPIFSLLKFLSFILFFASWHVYSWRSRLYECDRSVCELAEFWFKTQTRKTSVGTEAKLTRVCNFCFVVSFFMLRKRVFGRQSKNYYLRRKTTKITTKTTTTPNTDEHMNERWMNERRRKSWAC